MNAIITGATKGIGKAIALKLAIKGYNLAVCARTETDLQLLKDELAQYNVKVIALKADMGNKDEIYNFCNEVKSSFNNVDVLINNAGVFMPGSILDEEDKNFEYQGMVNVNATYYLSKYFGKMMRSQRNGHIFNICSVASLETIENASSYCVTKTAMLSLNNVLRKELAQYNVKVTAILPGSTLTASWEGTEINPDKFVQPEDIANSLYSILTLSSGVNVDEIILKPLNF
ncbi:SDR family oxidoreductase [Pedobacter polaris]|uniref:SDR family oxidoreductase n=1 Tax=Pedobacter polaris TaxID=2571273 RepID=A0A4U1CKE4_9SPHI|nr:SDR family oxidoreductase [Pedobacter polaris]TKC08120.1 SDR family oxidoreductase [Pedobacter polaris]